MNEDNILIIDVDSHVEYDTLMPIKTQLTDCMEQEVNSDEGAQVSCIDTDRSHIVTDITLTAVTQN